MTVYLVLELSSNGVGSVCAIKKTQEAADETARWFNELRPDRNHYVEAWGVTK